MFGRSLHPALSSRESKSMGMRPGIRPASFASTPDLDQGALPAGDKSVEGYHPKTVIVPLIVRVILVAVRQARVVMIVVPRAAPQRRPSGLHLSIRED